MKLKQLIEQLNKLHCYDELDVVIEHNGEPVDVTGWAFLLEAQVIEIRHSASEPELKS